MSDQKTKGASGAITQKPSWLFSFGVSKANFRQGKNGRVSFVFNKRAVSDVTSFTDMLERLTGKLDIEDFSKYLYGILVTLKENRTHQLPTGKMVLRAKYARSPISDLWRIERIVMSSKQRC